MSIAENELNKSENEERRRLLKQRTRAYNKKYYYKNKRFLNKQLLKERSAQYYLRVKNTPEYIAQVKEKHLKSRYGITLNDYHDYLKKQGNICPLCLEQFDAKKIACVDHNHETGKIRGLLHKTCNLWLSQIERADFLDRALTYLRKHNCRY